jgi:aryl-alcohol dehydrogenase-like predicted oxidoreductase
VNRRDLIRGAAGTALTVALPPLYAQDAPLIRKPIPGTDETLPAIGVGTNRYAVGDAEATRPLLDTLRTFVDLGGTLIDTAPMYRTSETVLGELVSELDFQGEVFWATKSDRDRDDGGPARVENSFRQLRTDVIDLMQVHNLRGLDMLPQLRELKTEGRIRYLGITTSRVAQFDEFIAVMKREPLDFIQVNYSLADRQAAERILPLALDQGLAVLVNLPLGRGRLFNAVKGLSLPDWAAEFDATSWAQFFLKYVISHPAATCAIPGMRKAAHAKDNLGAARGVLPDAGQRSRQEQFFDAL